MFILGYIACFLSGAAVVLAAVFLCRFDGTKKLPKEAEHDAMPDKRQEKLKEQWLNLLNYDGSRQGGEF